MLRNDAGRCHRWGVNIELDLASEDVRVLRGALLAARATELAEAHRRGFRASYEKQSESARQGMTAEVEHHLRRIELLDRLIAALPDASKG